MIKNANIAIDSVKALAPFVDDIAKAVINAEKAGLKAPPFFYKGLEAIKAGEKAIDAMPKSQLDSIKFVLKNFQRTKDGLKLLQETPRLAEVMAQVTGQSLKATMQLRNQGQIFQNVISTTISHTPKTIIQSIDAAMSTKPVLKTLLFGGAALTNFVIAPAVGATLLSNTWRALWGDTSDIDSIVKTITSKLSSYNFENQQWKATVATLNKVLEQSLQLYSYGRQEAEGLPTEEGLKSIPKYLSYQKSGKERLIKLFDYITSKNFLSLFQKSQDLDDELPGDAIESAKTVLEYASPGSLLDINIIVDAAKKGKDLLSVNDDKVESALNNIEKELARSSQLPALPKQQAEIYYEFKKIAKLLRLAWSK